ncbi:Alpha/beta superfamily hydrolase [Nocardioides exalbidus]|uniref:Alpha/beta superfamily hydrolase n=1 Tax=Nocardioides exalbidus TaxID=402596 RepID=A0A1H4TDN6_9ACTN|nr:alpha/beta hydrolase [Nocardioides exalbidus]SEC54457.1 Alpha/beta superfamily hydrolase [Nocardioides exalbidus]
MSTPRLIPVHTPREPQGVVLVLHGGASRGAGVRVSPTQLSVLRMVPVARRIARAGRSRLAVLRLLNTHRGWDAGTTPVMDVAWALGQVAEQHGDLPVALVGHSLGGRAALLGGVEPGVRSVVALNPWVQTTDRVRLGDTRTLVVHGTDDRIASPERALQLARRLSESGRVGYIAVAGGKHAMLRRGRTFERLAAEFVTCTLLGDPARSSAVREVLDGAPWVEV